MAGVFGSRQDAESENDDGTSRCLSGFDVTRDGPFLWLLSFGPAKESSSPFRAKAFDLDLDLDPISTPISIWLNTSKSTAFALTGELLFFAGAKKSNQKKAPYS